MFYLFIFVGNVKLKGKCLYSLASRLLGVYKSSKNFFSISETSLVSVLNTLPNKKHISKVCFQALSVLAELLTGASVGQTEGLGSSAGPGREAFFQGSFPFLGISLKLCIFWDRHIAIAKD